jgi:hypothetical protein
MASADDYAKWIVANADQKGTPQFDTVSKAYQQAKAEESAPPASTQNKPSSPAMDMLLRAVSSPIAAGETALHVASGIPNLVSRAFGGPDIQYQPRGLAGQEMSAAADYPGKIYGQAVEQQMLERAKGTPSVNIGGQNLVPSVGGMLYDQPSETPSESRAMAAGGALALNVLPMLAGGLAKASPAKLPINNTPSGLVDLFRQNVPAIAGNYVRSISGSPATREAQAAALTNPSSTVPGYLPTAAEALQGTSEGTPLQSLQRQISQSPAQTPGGGPTVSQTFAQRIAEQEVARQNLLSARDAQTAVMREQALAGANSTGGVPAAPLVKAADTMLNTPGLRASDVVTKAVGAVRSKLESLAGPDGKIDANDLYTVRKDMGKYIEDAAGSPGAKYDKKLAGGLQNQLQTAFDDAIERAGGQGWKAYLEKYAKMSQDEKAALDRAEAQYSQPQQTSLGGMNAPTSDIQTHIPHLLSRTATGVNWLASLLRGGIEGKVQGQLGDWLANPQSGELAAQLRHGISPVDMLAANAKKQALARALASGTIAGSMNQGQE